MDEKQDLSDYWTIKIYSKKYGDIYFSRINEKIFDVIEMVKSNPEKLTDILMENSFYSERNKILKTEIDFNQFSNEEKEEFYINFIPLQFEEYPINRNLSDYDNFEKAVEFWRNMVRKRNKEFLKEFYKSRMDMSLALSGNSFVQFDQILSAPYKDLNEQIQLGLHPFSESFGSIKDAIKIPSIKLYTENFYPSLTNALKGFNETLGPLVAKITDPLKSFSEQMAETQKTLGLSFERCKSAIDLIPEYFSISKIARDEENEINLYIQNTHDENELEYNINTVETNKGFIDFLHDIPKGDVIRFLGHLQSYPYLALIDDVGKKIFESIKKEIVNYTKSEKGMLFFHARERKKGTREFTSNEMWETHYGVLGMNRYNFIGKPAFYVATELETARKEVESEDYPESTVMKINLINEMTVFDISSEDCPLVSYCDMEKESGNNFSAYLIPNFLSVCCSFINLKKRHSVDAIKYKSNKNKGGICYVILDKSPKDFFDEGEIEVYE